MSVANFIRRSGVVLEVAPDAAGVAGAYVAFGKPKNSIQVSDSRGTTQITDFSTSATAISQQVSEGRTVGINWTANLVLDDSGYTTAKTGYRNDNIMYVRVAGTDARAVPLTLTLEYRGYFTDFSHTFNEQGVAEVAVTFAASDELTNAIA